MSASNTLRTAETVADNGWQNNSYAHKGTVTGVFAQAMQLPWADYQAQKAVVDSQWWQTSGVAEALAYTAGVNGAETMYRAATNAAYDTWSHATNAAEAVHTRALADAEYQQAIACTSRRLRKF